MAETIGVTVDETGISLNDDTDDNVSTTKHGFAPKAPNDAAQVLLGSAAWGLPTKLSVPGSAPTIAASQAQFYLDEGNNKLMVRVKYADGTQKTGEIALT